MAISRQVDEKQIEKVLNRAVKDLAPDVVRIRYSLEDDWSGDPAIFLRVLLSDEVVRPPRKLFPITEKIREKVTAELYPFDQGLFPYFSFRTLKEQKLLKEESWE